MSRKKIIAFIVLFVLIGIQVTSSIASENNNGFFYTNATEIAQGDTLEMILDISKIKNDKFDFKLSSNLDTSNIVINENVKVENYNNDISISIDKSKNSLNKITFYYKVPENAQVGTKIDLTAQIIVAEEVKEEKKVTTKNTVENTTKPTNTTEKNTAKNEAVANNTTKEVDDNKKQTETSKTTTEIITKKENKVVENKKIEIKIIEKMQSEKEIKAEEKNNKEKSSMTGKQDENNMEDKQEKSTNNEMKKENSSTQVQTEKAVYNGSNNNYLSNLEIEGEQLNTTFNKENTTYFVETTGKTELNVNAIKEDSTAKVQFTGNDNLKTGDNKILITVTAENGDVRYYRVFVTNK